MGLTMDQRDWEILFAAAGQVAAVIWMLSGMKTDIKNLTGWMHKLDKRSEETSSTTSELRGHVMAMAGILERRKG